MLRFDDGWRFGYSGDASSPDFDDSTWRTIDLPHDWSIEDLPPLAESPRRSGPFDPDLSGGKGATGYFVGGIAWYRKRFERPEADRAEIRFEGAYCVSDVWLNGKHLGAYVHGYTPFCYDLTPYLNPDGENVLAVRVKNEGANSRWYSGSGLYRHVWIKSSGRVFIPMDGVFVTTPTIADDHATIRVLVEVENATAADTSGEIEVKIVDPTGSVVKTLHAPFHLGVGSKTVSAIEGSIERPALWNLEDPMLYTASVKVTVGGVLLDSETATFGIRDVRINAEEGFVLNGQSIKIKGGCVHHDNGLLGAAAIDRAEVRRVELLKEAGFNAIRTSHNAPSSAFLDACDRLGMLVMDEAFDEWGQPKTADSYALQFDRTSDAVLTTQVRRDRNHASVVMWSIGNEIPECFVKTEIARRLRDTVLASDPTRPVSQGVCRSFWEGYSWSDWQANSDPAFLHLDVGGYNYLQDEYELDHARHPERAIVGTESFPKDIFDVWTLVEKHPYVIGDFTWTALDYYGESGIGHIKFGPIEERGDEYPRHMASCGDLDILGNRKPPSYYRQVLWQKGILYAVVGQEPDAIQSFEALDANDWRPKWGWPNVRSHWTYPGEEGQLKDVVIYASCDSVRLSLNGRLIGEQATGSEQRHLAKFEVPYEPGVLTAKGLIEGKQVEFLLKTAGDPASLRLSIDRSAVAADRNDLCYITIEVVDANGTTVPAAAHEVKLNLDGVGELIAFGNADPVDVSSVRVPLHRAWQGVLQAIVRPTGLIGTIRIEATAEGLGKAIATVTAG
jgi:beta-galactosidase